MVTFDTIRQSADNRKLIRKVQKSFAFLLPTTTPLPTTLYATGSLIDFGALTGAISLGIITPDGFGFGREMEKEEVDGLGYASPVRSDVTKVPRTVTVTVLESGRKEISELKHGLVITATQSPTTGEVVYDEPDLPFNREYRLIVVGLDGPADEEWIMGKGFGAVKLASTGDESWGAEAISTEFTFDVFTDDTTGTPVRHYLGGTGALKYKDVLGFTAGV